jgi:hypothetical protein
VLILGKVDRPPLKFAWDRKERYLEVWRNTGDYRSWRGQANHRLAESKNPLIEVYEIARSEFAI